ncbi:MAG TPA: hypothetical protein VG603_04770, partial [Chitinophagales bacterium]|nr:hypothetical protein [Chitinophagales bacterium]
MSTFRGKYFNGKSSAGFTAMVILADNYIEIHYTDPATGQQLQRWEPDKIHKTDFAENETVILRYGEVPFQQLEVKDSTFEIALKVAYPKARFHKSIYQALFKSGFKGVATLVLAAIGLVSLFYFVLLPNIAEMIAAKVPPNIENEIGESSYREMVQPENIDKSNTVLLDSFFKQMG